jgi:OmpA-OmpF porin, OOP family
MNANLLSLAQTALGDDFSKLAAQFLGESPGATQSAVSSLLPAVLGTIAHKGATSQGASGLMSLIGGANLDTSSLGNVAGLFGNGAGMSSLLKSGTNTLVPSLFGDKGGAVVNALSSTSGIKTTSATTLLAMVVPLVLTWLKKFIGDKDLNAGSLSTLLAGQAPNLRGAVDSRITSALGFASPGAFLGGLGRQTVDTAQRAGATVAGGAATATAAARSSFTRWLPWLIGAVVLFVLWNLLMGKPTPAPANAPMVSISGTSSTTTAAATFLPAKVYFDVGAAAIGVDGYAKIAAVAEAVKKNNLKVTVTGYTDRTGDLAQNQELARSRAAGVRDALTAAGVAATSIEINEPMLVEVGSAGADAEARHVEIGRH